MQKGKNIIPIIGARNEDQLLNNLGADSVVFTADQLQRLDEISKIELGFPHDFLKGEGVQDILFSSKRKDLK